jgi:acyl-CoA reductase-like NAD-dependent aldehyde dehydrogenase
MNFIGGRWVVAARGGSYQRTNPARPPDIIGTFPDSGQLDAEAAAAAAARAYPAWGSAPPASRTSLLLRTADIINSRSEEFAATLTREEGKPLARAAGEVQRCAEVFRYFAGEGLRYGGETLPSSRPGVHLQTTVEPLGPVLLITPFNFPLFVTALKLGAALAAGNTVVWKPSPHVPATSIALMQALITAGLPEGVLNVVLGATPDLGRALVDDPRIRAISFTGSTRVGLDVGQRAAARHVRVQQEMGGKNVLVITDDVEPAFAARIACESAFGESGQKCTAAGLIVVARTRVGQFLTEVEKQLANLLMGDGAAPGVDLGPLIDAGACERALNLLDTAVDSGATIELEGCRASESINVGGHYFAPRVVMVPDKPNVLRTAEAFAPIMAIVPADDVVEDGLDAIRASGMGLSASILTHRLDLSSQFTSEAQAGLVSVNLPTTGVEYQVPFGGWNLSGGPFPEGGGSGLDFFSRCKTLAVSPMRDQG